MMSGWWGVAEGLAILLVLLVLVLVALALRRRWLARQGGTFECSLRLSVTTPGSGWVLGVARYNEGLLEWFRFFSFSFRPRKSFPREDCRVLQTRDPSAIEAVALYAEQRIVRVGLEVGVSGAAGAPGGSGAVGAEEWELAMSPDSMVGLLSWLESAPPGLRRSA